MKQVAVTLIIRATVYVEPDEGSEKLPSDDNVRQATAMIIDEAIDSQRRWGLIFTDFLETGDAALTSYEVTLDKE